MVHLSSQTWVWNTNIDINKITKFCNVGPTHFDSIFFHEFFNSIQHKHHILKHSLIPSRHFNCTFTWKWKGKRKISQFTQKSWNETKKHWITKHYHKINFLTISLAYSHQRSQFYFPPNEINPTTLHNYVQNIPHFDNTSPTI